MAPRASWRGFLKIGEVSCAVALYAAASTSDRVAFHMINRKTGHRLRRDYVDSETGKAVDSDDQVKGYETDGGDHILFEPDELRAVVPQSDKQLDVDAFIASSDVDLVYFDRPYFLAPGDKAAVEAFNLMREGLKARKVVALARAVLFRRCRTLLIRPHGAGLLANTLNFDHEVREAAEVFSDIDDMKIEGEMLDLARHIIETKSGRFDPASFSDRYDDALAELVRAKAAGKALPKAPEAEPSKVVDLMAALRESAKATKKPAARKVRKPAAKAPAQKKAS